MFKRAKHNVKKESTHSVQNLVTEMSPVSIFYKRLVILIQQSWGVFEEMCWFLDVCE